MQYVRESRTTERRVSKYGKRDSPHVNADAPEGMYGRVELTADEDEGIADVLLVCSAGSPPREDLLKLLGETEQSRHSALHLGLGARV